MAVTLSKILRLPVLVGARVVAGHRGLEVPVRWCHSSEVLDIARLLSGGEILLTTGMALDVSPGEQAAYAEELHQRKVAGLMLELGRTFHAAPPALVEACDRLGLPLVTLPFDTPFVKVTEAVHELVLSARAATRPATQVQAPEGRLLADLWAGLIVTSDNLKQRLADAGRPIPDPIWIAVMVADGRISTESVKEAAAAELGPRQWLLEAAKQEKRLVGLSHDPRSLARGLRAVANRLAPLAAGVGRCNAEPQSARQSLAEARQTMRLRRIRPFLDPLFTQTGVYRLALGHSSEGLHQYVAEWLGPLLHHDRLHKTNLCQTLLLLLNDRLGMAEAATQLHLTRQGLYHRQERISEILGRDLDDPEVRLTLAVALRCWDVLSTEAASGEGDISPN